MKLRAGIIGLGVGEAHIEGYNTHPDCEVVALCDFSDERLEAAKKKYANLKIVNNASDIIEDSDIDVVSIASYDNYHYEQIVGSLENNKHVFVEKPLCLYKNEALHIRDLLENKKQLKLSSNLILRKCPRFELLRHKIRSGEMGRLFHVEGNYNYGRLHKITEGWRGKVDFYSVVYGGAVHIIDLLLWLTEERVVEVSAYGNNISSAGTQFQYDDIVTGILKFDNGMTGTVSVNFGCVMPHFHGLTIYGTNATFINGNEYGLLYNSRDPSDQAERITEAYPGVQKGDLIYSFVESIVRNAESEISKEEVFKCMSICFAMEKAVKSGPVTVEYI